MQRRDSPRKTHLNSGNFGQEVPEATILTGLSKLYAYESLDGVGRVTCMLRATQIEYERLGRFRLVQEVAELAPQH